MIKKILIFLAMAPLFTSCGHWTDAPKNINPATIRLERLDETNVFSSPTRRLYSRYLNSLGGVRHGSCPMFPSCSQYSKQAIKKFGVLIGWVMTFDRLLRCGRDETSRAPSIFIHGAWRSWDPVENNDFWMR